MAADLEEWNDERSEWKVGGLLQASVKFFGAQLRILRATTTVRDVRWNCCPSQTDAAGATSAHRTPPSRPSPPAPSPHRVACICRPTDGRTDIAPEHGKMDSSVRPSVRPAGCHQLFQPRKKKHMRCRVVVDILPNQRNPPTPTDRRINRRTEGERTAHMQLTTSAKALKHSRRLFCRKYFICGVV